MKIHHFGSLDSTFDKAWKLVAEKRLSVWDSVQAREQSAGRGQMRSVWVSRPGNLFATLRLPDSLPFSSQAGAIAFGALSALAINELTDCKILIKWPNDLVIINKKGLFKVGGILLEEREGIILAGIGINLANAPSLAELEDKSAIQAGALGKLCSTFSFINPDEFWLAMCAKMCRQWQSCSFSENWLQYVNENLALRGDKVCIINNGESLCGKLLKIANNGAAIIEADGSEKEWTHGTLRKDDCEKS